MSVRYHLRSSALLASIMKHPGRGAPYSVRSLAHAVGSSSAMIGHLRSGRVDHVDVDTAHRISEALGVAVLVLFAPPSSPKRNETATVRYAPHPADVADTTSARPHPA